MNINEINTSYPGKIVSFNPEEQTAVVQIAMEGYFQDQYTRNEKYTISPIIDVPVHFPKAGGFSITMPVTEGDDCLLVFAQRGIDQWLYENKQEIGLVEDAHGAGLQRMLDRTDALCFVGFSTIPAPITNFNPNDVELRNADSSQIISLKKNKDISLVTTANVDIEAADVNITASGTMTLAGATIHINEG